MSRRACRADLLYRAVARTVPAAPPLGAHVRQISGVHVPPSAEDTAPAEGVDSTDKPQHVLALGHKTPVRGVASAAPRQTRK